MSAQPAVDEARRRFTVDEYEQMGRAGIFGEDDRVELLEGEIVRMTPIGPTHASVVDRLTRLLVRRSGDGAIVRVQNPIRLAPHSEPQPDLVLARPRDDFYASAHPSARDVWLVVEVADSSLAIDSGVKIPIYARAGIGESWVVRLADRAVVVHRTPMAGRYRDVQTYHSGQAIDLRLKPPTTVSVDEILG